MLSYLHPRRAWELGGGGSNHTLVVGPVFRALSREERSMLDSDRQAKMSLLI
jgi:hypothetical protein